MIFETQSARPPQRPQEELLLKTVSENQTASSHILPPLPNYPLPPPLSPPPLPIITGLEVATIVLLKFF